MLWNTAQEGHLRNTVFHNNCNVELKSTQVATNFCFTFLKSKQLLRHPNSMEFDNSNLNNMNRFLVAENNQRNKHTLSRRTRSLKKIPGWDTIWKHVIGSVVNWTIWLLKNNLWNEVHERRPWKFPTWKFSRLSRNFVQCSCFLLLQNHHIK